MDLKSIRTALKDAITIDGLAVSDLRTDPNPPCVMVYPKHIPYDDTFDGGTQITFTVLVLVPYANTSSAQDKIDAYLSDETPESIKNAIEADQTLEGVVSDCIVTGADGYRPVTLTEGATQYLSAELTVEVWT